MIYHFCPDEKFIDEAIQLFNATGDGHKFIVFGPHTPDDLKYITKKCHVNCVGWSADQGTTNIAPLLHNARAVVFHSLTIAAARHARLIPSTVRLAWLSFGFDIYRAWPRLGGNLHSPYTAAIARDLKKAHSQPIFQRLGRRANQFIKRLLPSGATLERDLKYATARADYCATVVPDEWPIIQSIPRFRANLLRFNYGWIESIVRNPETNNSQNGGDVLVGNSSTSTNNHVDVFMKLRPQLRAGTKVYVPLSYGDEKYRDRVLLDGRRILGNAFHPMVEYLTRENYAEILRNCGTVIMGHRRQQAMGNIIASLYFGAKVYLFESNPVHTFLTRLGVQVGNLDQVGTSEHLSFQGVPDSTLADHRRILRNEYSWERGVERARALTHNLLESHVL